VCSGCARHASAAATTDGADCSTSIVIAWPPPSGRAASQARSSRRLGDERLASSSNIARLGRSGKLRPGVVVEKRASALSRATGAFQTRECFAAQPLPPLLLLLL
jgi:hypothetical protein